jgi:hypothetical protein
MEMIYSRYTRVRLAGTLKVIRRMLFSRIEKPLMFLFLFVETRNRLQVTNPLPTETGNQMRRSLQCR